MEAGALAASLTEAVRRHESLRTTFALEDGEPVQVVDLPRRVELPVVDLRGAGEPEARRLTEAEAARPFDLEHGPLLRAVLLRLGQDEHRLVLVLHHIVADGRSLEVLVKEFAAVYAALLEGRAPGLPELPVQYADYTLWQRDLLAGDRLASLLAWWRECLAGLPPSLELPADRPRRTGRGASIEVALPPELSAAVHDIARREGATVFMVLLAAFQALLSRLTGEQDLAVGVPVANRPRPELEGLAGFFVNTLVMRGDLAGNPTFRRLLERTREAAAGAYAHQELPFERLVEELSPDRSLSRPPLVQVMLNLQGSALEAPALPGAATRVEEVETGAIAVAATLDLRQTPAGLAGRWRYDRGLFDRSTVKRFARGLEALLAGAAAGPGHAVADLPVLAQEERAQLLCEWNDTAAPPPAEALLHRRFEARAESAPGAVAVSWQGLDVTYGELARRAADLAAVLRLAGVGPETCVAVAADRDPSAVAALLAVLRAGGAYVPLDPSHPQERLELLLEDSRPRVLLAGRRWLPRLGGAAERAGAMVLDLDAAVEGTGPESGPAPDPGNAAYVLYTSGSTGQPKGVVVPHRAAVRFLDAMRSRPGLAPGDRLLAVTTLSFDISVLELFLPLSAGACVVLADRETAQDGARLARALDEERITVLQATPATWRLLLESGWKGRPGLRLLCGGEALSRALAGELLPRGESLWNLYGPTETTVWSAAGPVRPEGHVTVGRPIEGTEIYLLDRRLQPVALGAAGEVYIGGEGVSRGYLDRPDLTAERFLPDPFASRPAARLYRVGDIGRFRPDGELEVLGRVDHQLKLRGFRVEPGEIERALAACPGVAECAVMAVPGPDGGPRLVAWVAGGPPPAELRVFLADRLPGHMVPAAFESVSALPRLPNGKLDRRALAAAAPGPSLVSKPAAAPRTPIEEVLAGIWAEVLNLPEVAAGAHFFDLGGHSLLATRVVSGVRQALGVELPVAALFEAPDLASFGGRVEAARRLGGGLSIASLERVPRDRDLPLSFAQQRLWFLDRLVPENPFYNMACGLRLAGELDAAALAAALSEVVRRHEPLRTAFPAEGGVPRQVISPLSDVPLPVADLSALAAAQREAELEHVAGAAARRPFDLGRGPLLRALLVRLGLEEHALAVTVHHIVSDGWSLIVLEEELAVLYGAFREGRPAPLPDLPVQYADFAVWQRRRLSGEGLESLLADWKERLAGAPDRLELPADRPRGAGEARGGSAPVLWPAALGGACRTLARREGATPAMTVLAVFQALLSRLSGQEDLLVGSPVANRNRREIEGLIGFFANTLVLRGDLSGDPSFRALLARVRETSLAAYDHQELPFEKLVEELDPERSLGRNPLVQVVLGFQNLVRSAPAMPGLAASLLGGRAVDTGTSKFDLTLFLWEEGQGLRGLLEYDRGLFDRPTALRLLDQLEGLLGTALEAPETRLSELPLLSPSQRHQLIREWGGGSDAWLAAGTLADRFAARARLTPDAVAVTCSGEALTYAGLADRAGAVARRLSAAGTGRGALVPLLLERSAGLVAGILGVLAAGAAYVPLDPDAPPERLAFALEDTGAALTVTQASLAGRLPAGSRVLLVDGLEDGGGLPPCPAVPLDPAYAIYTSGSTGRPKGVLVSHASVLRLFEATDRWFGFGPDDVWSLFHSCAFDFSVWELWGALLHGGRLVVVPHWVSRSPEAFWELLLRERVTVLNQTPSAFRQLLWAGGLGSAGPGALRLVVFGGEALEPATLAPWFERHGDRLPLLVNMYGITETTVHVTLRPLRRQDADGPVSAIGVPIPDLSLHVVDRDGSPVPVGVPGELRVGGAGLALGYLRRPDLTAERFVPDPFGPPGARLYCSGDLARRWPDGDLEYLGRIDHQVKIRGFRIELGEIESTLARHPAVRESAVTLWEDGTGDRRLAAYVVHDPAWEPATAADDRTGEQISHWREVFNEVYRGGSEREEGGDPTFNIVGWDSAWTGEAIPAGEMREWLDDTIDRLRLLGARRVLEIGCGTGMLLFRLAPGCETYTATDLSPQALAWVAAGLAGRPEASRVTLLRRGAHDFAGLADGSFDAVVLNSVAQYFPSVDYLVDVIGKAVRAVRPGGAVFLGDLRSLPLLPAFQAGAELLRAEPELPLSQLRQRVRARALLEDELLLDPALFGELRRRLPGIGRAEVLLRRGRARNELNAFRYQAVLRVGEGPPEKAPKARDWELEGWTLERLAGLLERERPGRLLLSGVPNARVAAAAAAAYLLAEQGREGQAGGLRRECERAPATAVDPQALLDLATEAGYEADFGWARHGADGRFDAIFRRPGEGDGQVPLSSLLPGPAAPAGSRSWSAFANDPFRGRFAREAVPELRRFLGERLPDYMVPAAFVFLDSLPLTGNGKADRRALPPPVPARPASGAYEAPRTPVERRLVAIWEELLGLDRVGVHDDFFALGGHSLLATRVVSRLRSELGVDVPLRRLFEAPTVAALAREAEVAGIGPAPPLRRRPDGEAAPLSFAQERLWFLDQLTPGRAVYNVPAVVRLEGRLDVAPFEAALEGLALRHETLRTTVALRGGEAAQAVSPDARLPLPLADLQTLPAEARRDESLRLAGAEARRPFDLESGPLARAVLLRLGPEEHLVLLSLHHLVCDGWSIGVLLRDLAALYEGAPLPELPVRYTDWAAWQRQWLTGAALEARLAPWRRLLEGVPPQLGLPADRQRPAVPGLRGGVRRALLPGGLPGALRRPGREQRATPFMALLAAFQVLLYRHAGQEDFCVGSPVANRTRAEVEGLVGLFVNALALRADLSGDPTFAELVERVAGVTLEAYENQDLPFERLVAELRPERDLGRQPLFQVVFLLQNAPMPVLSLPGLTLAPQEVHTGTAKFDLTLELLEVDGGFAARLEHAFDLFDPATVVRLLERYAVLLDGAADDPDRRVSELPLLPAAERHQLLVEAGGACTFPVAESLHRRFEERARAAPDSVAVTAVDRSLTYGALDLQAGRVARALAALGACPESRVALLLPRSPELVAAVLGVLKTGAAYVPIEPGAPEERLAFLLADSGAAVLVTTAELSPASCLVPIVTVESVGLLEPLVSVELPPESAAYVIYTSGSTGRPKGVVVSHANAVRLFDATRERFGFGAGDVWTLFHSYAFDFSVWEIWGALLHGGRLAVVPWEVSRSPEVFLDLLAAEGVTVLSQTPSAFRQLVAADTADGPTPRPLALRWVVFGGEALDFAGLRSWVERRGDRRPRLMNMYGITETTVHVTWREVRREDLEGPGFVGGAIPDLRLHLLDARLSLVPLGVLGEIYVGGAGVARGYLERPDLTAERFVPDPFADDQGARLYRSGDLARCRANGEIEYLGRIDHQVKIRGVRIELGEVEAALAGCPGVQESAVLSREDALGERRLVAYVVPGRRAPTVADLRRDLGARLPEALLPSVFVLLDAFPLTANGKLDRRALPAPGAERPDLGQAYVAAATPAEEGLAAVWAEALGLDRVGVEDNFFVLGGDSIRAIRLRHLAAEKGLRFPLHEVFRSQTVRALASALETGGEEPGPASGLFSLVTAEDRERLPSGIEDAYPVARLQAGLLFHGEARGRGSTVYLDVFRFHLRAAFDGEALAGAVGDLVRRHEALRTSFDLGRFREPLQLVHREVPLPLDIEDIRDEAVEARVEAWIEARKAEGFNLSRPPLLRFAAHRAGGGTFHMTLVLHHAILDGWSVATLLSDLFRLYQARLGEPSAPLAPLQVRFRDFVARERAELESGAALDFWRERLEGTEPTRLPRPARPPAAVRRLGSRPVPVPAAVLNGLRATAALAGVHLKHSLFAAYARALGTMTGRPEAQTGVAFNGRPEEEGGERIVGLFLNTLPLRLDLRGGTWLDLVRRAFETEREVLPHRRYPLADLQREMGGKPLFETAFNFVHFHVYRALEGLPGLEVLGSRAFAESEFALLAEHSLSPDGSRLSVTLDYDARELEAVQIDRLAGHLAAALAALSSRPETDQEAFSLLSEAERHQLTAEWNDTAAPYPARAGIDGVFREQARRRPDAVAVEQGGARLTYGELDRLAGGLARRLLRRGVGPETLVGLCLERSPEMVVALLSIVRAGGAYVPLDPSYPRERLAFLLEDTGVGLVLTTRDQEPRLPWHGGARILLDDLEGDEPEGEELSLRELPDAGGDSLAYVTYTSGSTGVPKGVAVCHRAVLRLVLSGGYAGLGPEETLLLFSPLAFDASTFEVWGCLLRGGRLVIAPPGLPSLAELARLIESAGVTTIFLTTSLFHQLAESHLGELRGLRQLLTGGDVISPAHLRMAAEGLPGCRVSAVYGPTESTTFATAFPTCPEELGGSVPLGRPIGNTEALVLDAGLLPVPPGAPGELWIGGDGLARGYWNRPGLTAERFRPHPHASRPGERLYRTGDVSRRREDGVLEFLGRVDDQVKIRGHRVEPGEVEAVLASHPDLSAAAVLVRRDAGGASLAAFAVPAPGADTGPAALRGWLEERLPAYLVPASIAVLPELPLAPSGKVDRRALLADPPAEAAPEADPEDRPAGPVQEILAGLWAEVLGRARVGARESFFELGGHSLAATRLVSRVRDAFGVELPLLALFEEPTVEGLAERVAEALRSAAGPSVPPLVPADWPGDVPLSFAQQRLWFLDRWRPGDPTYNVPGFVRLRGPLCAPALFGALAEVVRRQASLRTTFSDESGVPFQRVSEARGLPVPLADLAGLPASVLGTEAERLSRDEARAPFDLGRGPVLRARLLRVAAEEHRLLLTVHHAVADGASVGVLLRELGALYEAAFSGVASPLPDLPVQYTDFAVWQRAWLGGEALEEQVAGWRRALEGLPPLDLPGDRPRPTVRSGRGGTVTARVAPEAARALVALARREGSTLFMVLLGAFQALLARLSGASDLAVGAPVGGRRWREVEGLIGFFVNTLVLRARFADNPSVGLHLARTREAVLSAFARQDAPFELLVEHLEPERNPARPPLVQAMAVLQEPPPPLCLPGLDAEVRAVGTGTAKLDLTLVGSEADAGALELSLEHDLDLFDRVTALRLLGACARLLEGMADRAALDGPVLDLPLLGESEQAQIVVEWNDSGASGLAGGVVERFEDHARCAPGALAVSGGGRSLSYGELDALSGRLAARLARLGAGPEAVVVLRLERTPGLVAAMLGVLKAGGAFLPLDPSSPPERLESMIAASGADVAITEEWLAAEEEGALSRAPVSGGQLAYVIFTSGSTGRPKGVALTRAGLDNLVRWHLDAFGVTAQDRASVVAGLGFDAAIWEVWPYLAAGASLHLPPEEVRLAPERLAAWLAAERITVAFLPTPMAERLAEVPWPASSRPRLLLTGGDRLRLPTVGMSLPAPLVNNYGPTEGSVVATSGWVGPGEVTPPIGRPVTGVRVHLLDAELRPVPLGAPGELCLAGAGLARGYLGQPAPTAAAFVPDPFPATPGDRLYRTGDRARWRPDGMLEFLGRIDAQVKIRGFRVEPGEAEAALRRQPGVRDAAVVARADGPSGDARLVAWVVGEGWTSEGLRRALREVLPDFLVPSTFVALDVLPLTPNGKVDRRALALLVPEPVAGGGEDLRTATEERLATLWSELLGVALPARDSDFFALGGHSLLAARLAARLGQVFGLEPPLRALFEASSLAAMAALVEETCLATGGGASILPLRRTGLERPPLSFAQQRLWFLDQLRPGSAAYTMPVALRASGRLDPALLAAVLGEVVRRHETLRTTFEIEAGVPFQRVAPWPAGRPAPLPEVDLRALPSPRTAAEAARLVEADARRPFHLRSGPLVRFGLVRLAAEEHILLASFHHTVSDGWSFAVFARDLAAVHEAFAAGRPSPLPGLPVRYADFAVWQRLCLEEGGLEADRNWWMERLGGELPALDLPGSPARPGEESRATAWLDAALASGLSRLARDGGATLFMGLLALAQLLLARLSGEEDVIVGAPAAGRPRPELEGLVGLFLNTLALRTDLSGDPSFRALLKRARDSALGAFAHQLLPFERLVEELQPDRDPARNPVFDVMVNLLNMPRQELRLAGLNLTWQAPVEPEAKVGLTLFAAEEDGGLRLDLLADRRRFSAADASRMLEQLEVLLRGALAAPEAPVGDHRMLTRACRAVLPDPSVLLPEPRYEPVTALFAAWAGRAPASMAVVQGKISLTYRELLASSSRLAAGLAAWGVETGTVVAVRGERGPGLIATVTAVLASGGVLLLLDPELPAHRHLQMVELAGAARLLWLGEGDPGMLGLPAVLVDPATGASPWTADAPLPDADPDGAAYVFFTSGSTGVPKGVVGVHKGLSHFVAWERERFGVAPADRCAQLAAPAVDVILRESFLALTSGAVLVLPDAGAGLEELPAWCERERITIVHTVPTLARSWLAAPPEVALPSLRWLLLVGEPLPAALIAAWRRRFPGSGVVNLYGSTESNLAKSFFVVPDPPPPGTQPAGRPLPESQLLVVGDGRRGCAVGEVGEIVIRTPFLSLGYLGRPEETAARFAPNPFPLAAGERILLTGDRGRFRPDGAVEVLGRLDHQMKVRGVRVEPEEVAAVLAEHPGVAACAALAVASGDGYRLVACVVPREPAPASAELLGHAARRLPAALVPSEVVLVDRIPLTATGKLDRRALARRAAEAAVPSETAAPRTPVEELVAGVWAEVLGVERVGAHDNFFALGGHSLLATQIVARLRALFGVELPVRRLFEAPTVAALAEELSGAETADRPSPRRGEDRPLSFAQERMWLLEQLAPGSAAYNIPFGLRLRGPLDLAALERAFTEVLRCHEVLRAAFPQVDGAPVQSISPALPFRATVIDLRGREAELSRLCEDEARRPFDLAAGPLYRLTVVRLGDEDHALLLAFHHAVFDGWSRGILAHELSVLYRGEAVAPLLLQYADYAAWQRERLAGGALDADLAWWRETLAGAPAEIALPMERRDARPAGAHHRSLLPPELAESASALGRRAGATKFMVLLAAFDLLLWRWSGQDDLVVGTVVAHRGHVEIEALIGCFINFLPVRLRVMAAGSGLDLLHAARSAVLGAYAHQDLPFEKLVEAMRSERGSGRSPLYNVGFLLQSFPAPRGLSEELEVEALPVHNGEALLDLRLVVLDGGELWWEYDRSRFQPATIELLADAYRQVLRGLVEHPEAGIASAELPAGLARTARERVVVAATFTADPVLQPMRFWLERLGLDMDAELAPYHQVFQQLLDPNSRASANQRGANVILARLEDWTTFRDGGVSPSLHDEVERAVGDLVAGLREVSGRIEVPWIVIVCPPSPAFAAAVDGVALEQRIVAEAEALAGIYAVPARELAELYPVPDLHDAHADRLGHVPYTPTFFTALGTIAVRRLHALRRPPYKVAVVDADNTLWTGVCGEDGPAGVVVDAPRRALQEFLLKQREAGMLLCLCSKNEEVDIVAVFAAQPGMPLRPEHFAASRVSWNRKSEGILSLAAELGLGLDSFILLDDNPLEIAEVQAECPGVLCLRVPEDPRQIPAYMRHLWAFDRPKLTAEDRARAESYRQNREREKLRQSVPSLEAFLSNLELAVDVRPIAPEHLPRVAQLVERTSQFNLTLVRRSEAEVRRFLADGGEGLEVSVRDRFGDYGLVGVALFTCGAEELAVDTLLLSCRVLGRGVEHRLLARLGEIAAGRGLARLDLAWVAGERNRPALEFLEGLAGASRAETTFRVPVDALEERV